MITNISFGIIFILILLYYYFKIKYSYWKIRKIPGPKPMLLFGNIKDNALRIENLVVTSKKIYDAYPNEAVVGIYRMTSPCLLLRDLDIIKNVMIKDFDIFEDRGIEFSKDGLGANLFHADGETWRVLRSKFTPMFTTSKLKNMVYLINEQGDKFMNILEKTATCEREQEMYYNFKKYTMTTIMSCAFGLTVDTSSESLMKPLAEVDNLAFKTHMLREVDMMFPGLLKNLNLSLYPTDVAIFFNEMVSTVIKERNGKPSKRNDFMDLILEMREQGDVTYKHENKKNYDNVSLKLTNSIIAAQAFVFFIAGFETSASMLAYMMYELSRNPEVQDKAIQEVDAVLKKHNGQITYETICDLTYIENVFNETYRKYPILSMQRKANSNYKIPGTSITIEKNTLVTVSALGIHYDEKYYPNPEKFDPERFNLENSKDRHPCAFLPFGVGPRNCIGMRFAKLQTRICALKLLSKFRVAPSKKTTKMVFDPKRLILNPAGGVYLELIPRINTSET